MVGNAVTFWELLVCLESATTRTYVTLVPFQKARLLKASHFESRYELGHKISFICVAEGNPRPTITWRKDGQEIPTHKFLKVCAIVPMMRVSECRIL